MTQDEIIRMAREAGMEFVTTNSYSTRNKDVTHLYQNMYGIEKMERFAALVAAHEREACAKACETVSDNHTWSDYIEGCDNCAAAIRGRSHASN